MIGFASDAYWLDLGTPEQYLRAHADLLAGKVRGRAYDAPWVAPGASVDPSARVGPAVAIGAGSTVEADAQLDESVLLPDRSCRRVRGSCAPSWGRMPPWVRVRRSSGACWGKASGRAPERSSTAYG